MPAVFTSSSGGDIGGGLLFTRLRGPVRAGYPTGDPGGGTLSPTANANGSAAIPMYAFANQFDTGIYLKTASATAPDMRLSALGGDVVSIQSSQMALATSYANFIPGAAVTTSGSIGGYVFISQTSAGTFTTSTANTQPAGPTAVTPIGGGGAAAIVWDAVAKRFGVFSTVQGSWLWTAVMTSG